MPKFALQFIAGKYEGGTFVVPDDRELFVGRATDIEVVLIEDMVSRRHAQLRSHDGRLLLRDLGSTNGTFVNGERIEECELELQDRVLIGTSMLRVVGAAEVASKTIEVNLHAAGGAGRLGATREAPARDDRGELGPGRLVALLHGWAERRQDGDVTLTLGDDRVTLALRQGALVHAALASDPQVTPLNALRHVLDWHEGSYAVAPASTEPPKSFAEPTAQLLAEAERQNTESRRRYAETWRDAAQLELHRPFATPLRALNSAELDALQLVLEWQTVEAVLEHAHHDDYAVLGHLDALVTQGILARPS